jgi:hypothetical protein
MDVGGTQGLPEVSHEKPGCRVHSNPRCVRTVLRDIERVAPNEVAPGESDEYSTYRGWRTRHSDEMRITSVLVCIQLFTRATGSTDYV